MFSTQLINVFPLIISETIYAAVLLSKSFFPPCWTQISVSRHENVNKIKLDENNFLSAPRMT